MSDTLPRPRATSLDDLPAIASAVEQKLAKVTELAVRYAGSQPAKPCLRPAARLDVEQARKFVMELDTAAASASPLLAMFLLGRCAEHAQALLDILDSVVAL